VAFLARVQEAALLAKADLDTQMVGEFAELQGIMGVNTPCSKGRIDRRKGDLRTLPPHCRGGDLPETDEGAVISIADKLDSICGFSA